MVTADDQDLIKRDADAAASRPSRLSADEGGRLVILETRDRLRPRLGTRH